MELRSPLARKTSQRSLAVCSSSKVFQNLVTSAAFSILQEFCVTQFSKTKMKRSLQNVSSRKFALQSSWMNLRVSCAQNCATLWSFRALLVVEAMQVRQTTEWPTQ
jgi:hypothetical protein